MRPSHQDGDSPPGPPHSGHAGALGRHAHSSPGEAPATLALQHPEELLRQLISTKAVAELLGVSSATVERAIRSGQLPVLHFRRKRYVSLNDLVSFMREPQKQGGHEGMDAAVASILASVQR